MKLYLVFSYPHYYPGGGWNDHRGIEGSHEEAKARLRANPDDGGEIIEIDTDDLSWREMPE